MEIASGRYWDNRDAGSTDSSGNWAWICSDVSNQVHYQGRDCGHKKSVQHNGETD